MKFPEGVDFETIPVNLINALVVAELVNRLNRHLCAGAV